MFRPLHHRNFWSLDALSRDDVVALLECARVLKRTSALQRPLRGKNLALLAQGQPAGSVSEFERAATELGAKVATIRPAPEGTHSTARLLGRLYDAIDCEGLEPGYVQQLERDAGVPVFNGLSGAAHPTQVLALLLSLQERSGKPLSQLHVAYVGDAHTAEADALMHAAALAGLHLHVAFAPCEGPQPQRLQALQTLAQRHGGQLVLSSSPAEATRDADCVLDSSQLRPEATPAADHRCTLQAMLLCAIA